MRVEILSDTEPVQGHLLYRKKDFSFDFRPHDAKDVLARCGKQGFAAACIGTLQIEVGVETRNLLYVWGYHHHEQWVPDHLPIIDPIRRSCRLDSSVLLKAGVGVAVDRQAVWRTKYDHNTGWIRIGADTSDQHVHLEFADNIVLGLCNSEIKSLWLLPTIE